MQNEIRPSDLARFWSKVDPTPTERGCLEWTAALARGYGIIRWKNNRMRIASRVAWEIATGRDPGPEIMRHTCDNALCVNVEHLIPGSYGENADDKFDRNPTVSGEARSDSRLTYDAVDEMRRLYRTGEWSFEALGRRHGVGYNAAKDAVTGKSWRRGPTEPPAPAVNDRKRRKYR